MGLASIYRNADAIRTGHRRAGAIGDRARLDTGEHVQAEDHVRLRIFEHTLLDHQCRAAFLTRRWPLFRGLENELDAASQLLPHAGQQLGNTHEYRHMTVVSAGVHDADFLAIECRAFLRREGQIDLLDDR